MSASLQPPRYRALRLYLLWVRLLCDFRALFSGPLVTSCLLLLC